MPGRDLAYRRSQTPHGSVVGALTQQSALGQDARGRGLARAARPDEKIGVREPVLRDGVFERPRDVLLADDVVKSLRPVFTRENLVTHGRLMYGLFGEQRNPVFRKAESPRIRLPGRARKSDGTSRSPALL